MLSSLLKSLKKVTVGDEGEGKENEVEATEDVVHIPQIETAITTNRSVPLQPNSNNQNADEQRNETETIQSVGCITNLDPSTDCGVIDRQYKFNIAKFCPAGSNFQRGSKVEFEAERTHSNPQWWVISMKLYESEQEKINRDRCKFRQVLAQVLSVHQNYIEVEYGKDKSASASRTFKIPKLKELEFNEWMPGDWMKVHLENIESEQTLMEYDSTDAINGKVLSVQPVQQRTLVGKVTKRFNCFLIDDSIYFTQEVCKYLLPLNTFVRCTAIYSTQHIGRNEFVSWRATHVKKSNFLHYTSPDAIADADEEWSPDGIARDVVGSRHQGLLADKRGIRISPSHALKFHVLTIGTTSVKTLTIKNTSPQTHHLRKIHFNQDASVCQFDVRSYQQHEDGSMTFLPEDEVEFRVSCRPLMIGRTTELCVFDFGDFQIARNFCVTGQSEEEDKLKVDAANGKPHFKKQIGEKDVSKIIVDKDRRRVRGSQIIRAPFFSQKRLPLNKVPNEMWKILKEQDERTLTCLYPNALSPLRFDNYKEKFMVSLWFEEMENDLRRKQCDLTNIVLKKHGNYYVFSVPGIQEFHPPVNVQDAIDVFDAEADSNAKFQGTITKINDGEVTCIFGDAFNQMYTGFPVTVQFCLGRTNYKRCHFAVQTAVEYLGERFLFPEPEFTVAVPRIFVYEDVGCDANTEIPMPSSRAQTVESDTNADGRNNLRKETIFRKPSAPTIFGAQNSSTSSEIGRRVPSVRSRFVSNTPSTPSCTTAKLEWFNTSLNDEQKDAVRRILRGQARPLPYIIYGPPGTGKTVTVVEAVMQVNMLDKNSRVLVCAPSNAAADIIAEYLANSNMYHPGDFVRLNGFLRSAQTMTESIQPFCVDGDDLTNVAMHRLIISTCITAGQFFTLDLSIGHFTHVFIDEAGYCTEPEAMIPSILLALSKGGQLILAGDPNQLGPVLMSDVSQNCGLNKSLLERLMTRDLYSRDTEKFPKEKYNPLVLTKLVKNYRAHPTLLKLPSRLFYDDDLISKADPEEVYALTQDPNMSSILVSQGVPLIFHGVQGQCQRERDSPSWCNKAEAVQVVHYVNALVRNCGLKYEDIGIITPYRKQVEKIRLALQINLLDDDLPKVASVEEFQGGERKVIIISTVRSVNEDKVDSCLERLGFLYQPKRFNVVITRAKALMIVVGNPHVLSRNNYWLQLLRYAIELNAYKGCNLPIHLDQEIRRILTVEESLATETSTIESMENQSESENLKSAPADDGDDQNWDAYDKNELEDTVDF